MATTVIKVGGMTCDGCARSVTRALSAVPGVSDVNVSLADGTARVSYDESKSAPAMLRQAVVDAGYESPEAT
jgi:copper chaperone CopZ